MIRARQNAFLRPPLLKGDGLDQHNSRQLSKGAATSQQALQIHHHVHHHAKERGRGQHLRIYGVGYNKRQLLSGTAITSVSKVATMPTGLRGALRAVNEARSSVWAACKRVLAKHAGTCKLQVHTEYVNSHLFAEVPWR